MQVLECVRKFSSGILLDEYFDKLSHELGVEIKSYELSNSFCNFENPLIVVVTSENLNEVKSILHKRSQKIIVAMNSRKDFKLVAELKSEFSKVFGFIDLSQEGEYNIPVMKNYLSLHFSSGVLPLEKLSNDLEKIYEFTKVELNRIKDLHDRLVKIRIDKLKGINVTSKFMAGESSGGEFFEVLQTENETQYIQAGSDSYLLSSLIVGELEELKTKNDSSSLENLSERFVKNLSHYAKENQAEFSYCLLTVSPKNLQVSLKVKGNGHIFYDNEWLTFTDSLNLKLKPKQRICLVSDGAVKNWNILSKLKIEHFFKHNSELSTKDLINEFFFEVSREKLGSFLIYDALMSVIDIEETIIYQV